jgi:MFS family permease
VVTGARTAWQEPRLRALLVMTAVGGLFGGFFGALYIAFVLRTLGLGPVLLGLGIATGGLGALAGSFLAQRIGRWLGVGPAICITGVLSALGTLIVLLAPKDPVGATAALVVSQFLGDFFGVVPVILALGLRQVLLPHSLLGRVGATFRALNGGVLVVGAVAGGALGQAFGLRATLIGAIAGLLTGPVYGALTPLWTLKVMPTDET